MFTLNCKGRLLAPGKPVVMGILNTTPDSFYASSRLQGTDAVLQRAEQMMKDGATLLDIGGQSTRPGSEAAGAEEELKRVIPAIEAVNRHFPEAYISVDTYYGQVATAAVQAGACIINDISCGTLDEAMLPAVAALQVPYVLMHMKGRPENMQQLASYENVTSDVLDHFIHQRARLMQMGIYDIIIDPGFGFAKTAAHNFELLKNLSSFSIIPAPLLLGISRKSFIYKTLGITADEALNGTTALHAIGLMKGASILRVHDVKEAVETIRLMEHL